MSSFCNRISSSYKSILLGAISRETYVLYRLSHQVLPHNSQRPIALERGCLSFQGLSRLSRQPYSASKDDACFNNCQFLHFRHRTLSPTRP